MLDYKEVLAEFLEHRPETTEQRKEILRIMVGIYNDGYIAGVTGEDE